MSGLIDTIVRRRRASASSRLGPPAHLLDAQPWAEAGAAHPPVNGHAPAAVNGHSPEPAPEAPEAPAAAPVESELEPEPGSEPDVEPEPEPGSELDIELEPEPERAPDVEPEQPTTTFAAVEPEPAGPLVYPPLRERAALRRRARYLASVREVQLRDLGGFLLELHRFGRSRPDLVQAKLAATATTDAELRALHHRLDEEAPIGELRRPGIGGACEHCGAVHGSLDRFCASCGEPLP